MFMGWFDYSDDDADNIAEYSAETVSGQVAGEPFIDISSRIWQ